MLERESPSIALEAMGVVLIAYPIGKGGIGIPIGGGATTVVWATVVGAGIEPSGLFILLSVVTTTMGRLALVRLHTDEFDRDTIMVVSAYDEYRREGVGTVRRDFANF